MENSSEKYFKIAAKKLRLANEELFKNGDDFDRKFVCQTTHIALENYLKGFLAFHQITSNDENLEQLFKKCVAIDSDLQKIDFKNVICSHNDALFQKCDDVEFITACFEAVDNIDTHFRRINILN